MKNHLLRTDYKLQQYFIRKQQYAHEIEFKGNILEKYLYLNYANIEFIQAKYV